MDYSALISQILKGITAAIAAAPQVAALVQAAKDTFKALFEAGLISKEKQDALFVHVDGISAMAKAGIILPHWAVEPDPDTNP